MLLFWYNIYLNLSHLATVTVTLTWIQLKLLHHKSVCSIYWVLYHFELFGQGCDLWPLGRTCITGQMQCDTGHGPKFSQPLVHGFKKKLWFNLQWYYASATFAVTQDKWPISSISTGPVTRDGRTIRNGTVLVLTVASNKCCIRFVLLLVVYRLFTW